MILFLLNLHIINPSILHHGMEYSHYLGLGFFVACVHHCKSKSAPLSLAITPWYGIFSLPWVRFFFTCVHHCKCKLAPLSLAITPRYGIFSLPWVRFFFTCVHHCKCKSAPLSLSITPWYGIFSLPWVRDQRISRIFCTMGSNR